MTTRLQNAIQKASVLIEALPYIQSFRRKIVVVKLGGSVMGNQEQLNGLLKDVVFMNQVGMQPVIVHGGGAAISGAMSASGSAPRFVHGYRVTDKETIEIVISTLKEVNNSLEALLKDLGTSALGLCPPENAVLLAEKMELEENGVPVDLGFVGEVKKVDIKRLKDIASKDIIPVVAPLGMNERIGVLNINADLAACSLASAIGACKLVFISDIPGIMADMSDKNSMISHINKDDVEPLIKRKVVEGGMIPKVRAMVHAIEHGVGKVHIIDGRVPHSLLLEIFTDEGIGTEIVSNEKK